MRRKYRDCQRDDGNCSLCSMAQNCTDCHGHRITPLELARRGAGLTQQQLADSANVNLSLVQKIEGGDAKPGNLTAKNLLALADTLGIDPHHLL